jgi:hypothetical protein
LDEGGGIAHCSGKFPTRHRVQQDNVEVLSITQG